MFLVNHHDRLFNIPKKIYTNSPSISYNIFENHHINNHKGPSGCLATDNSAKISFLKSYSELLERRTLMVSYIKKDKIRVFNLVNKKIETIDSKKSRYNNDVRYSSDTTGTSAGLKSQDLIIKSILELLEKNSLFLFWYCNFGNEIILTNYHTEYTNTILRAGFKIRSYSVEYFPNTITIISLIIDSKETGIVSSGINCHTHAEQALENSIQEAFLLLFQENIVQKTVQSKSIEYNYLQSKKLKKISVDKLKKKYTIITNDPDFIINFLPKWIKTIFIIKLPYKESVIMAYSNELFNSIPDKHYIYLDKEINKRVSKITSLELNRIPECIIK